MAKDAMTLRTRAELDVSDLATSAFGIRDLMAWGTAGFIVIEGFTLLLCATVYVYLTKNFDEWPPAGTMRPDRLVPTIQLVLMLASLIYMRWLEHVAHERNLVKTRIGLTVATLISVTMVALRVIELTGSLNVRWDTNAYGSAQWLIVGAHGTLLSIQLVEIAGMAGIFWLGPVERKHFSDAADVSFYWMFIVLIWIPMYVLCFQLPHLI